MCRGRGASAPFDEIDEEDFPDPALLRSLRFIGSFVARFSSFALSFPVNCALAFTIARRYCSSIWLRSNALSTSLGSCSDRSLSVAMSSRE